VIKRYEDKEISSLWSEEATYRRWFEVEVAHLRQVAGPEIADALNDKVYPPIKAQVDYYERETGHDVAAFLRALDANILTARDPGHPDHIDPELITKIRSGLHYGLTSSDVVDTAMALGLLQSRDVVRERAVNLIETLHAFVDELGVHETIGRTHGQLAAPMPAHLRWSVLAEMTERAWTRLLVQFDWLDTGKLSGPVGTFSAGESLALAEMGLRESTCTQIVPRDRLAHWAHCMSGLATVCEAIATQVWLLAQEGIGELRVAANGQVGSSAMPHKVNPVVAENIRGLARMARSLAETLQLGVVQWGEHDLSHSSVERVAVPDLLHLVCTILLRTAVLVSGLSWSDPGHPSGYVDTSEEMRALQGKGMAYVDAHAQLTAMYRDGKIRTTTTERGQ